jgi:hypothetical protein
MCKLIEWPGYDQVDAFRLHKVINEPDFLPLHIVRMLAQAANFVRIHRGKLVTTPLGKSMLSDARRGCLPAILFHLAFWHMDLGYFGRGLFGSWPQSDAGVVLWSLSSCADDWQTSEKLTRLAPSRNLRCFRERGTGHPTRWRPGSSDPCSGSDCSNTVAKRCQAIGSASIIFTARRPCSIDCWLSTLQ